MSECTQNEAGHELEYKQLYGMPDDPLRVRQRADFIHCEERMWIVYERSQVESCKDDERG